MRKYIVFVIVAFLCVLLPASARPARPGKFTVTQPDGTRIELERHGDEWCHWLTDASGRMVRQGEDGFFRVLTETEATEFQNRSMAKRNARLQQAAARGKQAGLALGQRHFLVILVEFSDLSFKQENPRQAFSDMLNQEGYSEYGGTGSARDFYYDNSNHRFEPIFDVYGPVKVSKGYAYYGRNVNGDDQHPAEAVAEACTLLDEEIDFSQYDADGNGEVDMVFMYYAGYGEADTAISDTIWPHMYWLSYYQTHLVLDGLKIDTYACSNELAGGGKWKGELDGIGPVCHEFGHTLGLPDFYDTDYSTNGNAGALYSFSLMDSGSYNNDHRTPPYFSFVERAMLGWVDESDFLEFDRSGAYSIPSVSQDVAYRTFTDKDGEFFVYENRTKSGWDRYIPSEGLIVYHVDRSDNRVGNRTARELWEEWLESNAINKYGSHPCYYIVPAANQSSLNYRYEDKIAFPQESVNSYTPISWSGEKSRISFSDISVSDGMVSLRARIFTGDLDYPTIVGAESYRAGDRFFFALALPEGDDPPASVTWYYDDEPAGAEAVTLTAGDHTIEARMITAYGLQEILTLEITVL